MLNETINQTLTNLFVNGQIPIKVTMQSSTNWTQFFLSASLALLGTFGLFIIIYFPSIWSSIKSGRLSKISRYTKRNVVMIKHTQQALFSASMIDQRCFAMIGKQYTKSIQKHLMNTIDYDLNSPGKEKLVQFLTDGEVEHAYPLTINDLKNFGVSVYTLSDMKFLKTLSRIISSKGKEGVSYYKIKKWWKW